MEGYELLGRVGEGAHGLVFRARELATGRAVAIKRVGLRRPEDEGVPAAVLREVQALRLLQHENVVRLHHVAPHGSGILLVFECMASDLGRVMTAARRGLAEAQIKTYMLMLLRGIAYCHQKSIVHRDLKPANLLISPTGVLKIADFGLARVWQEDASRPLSHAVATRWYRAPELLYGARQYDLSVDMWAVGCVMGEMINNSPLFPGENDIDQLAVVLQALGTPTLESWPEMATLPDYNKIVFDECRGKTAAELVPEASEQALEMLGRLLTYRARNRLSAEEALFHSYFFEDPLPAHHSEMPKPVFEQEAVYNVSVPEPDAPLAIVDPALANMAASAS